MAFAMLWEMTKFFVVRCLNNVEGNDEMLVLAASLDDSQELEPGDIIWAKLTGMTVHYVFHLHCNV